MRISIQTSPAPGARKAGVDFSAILHLPEHKTLSALIAQYGAFAAGAPEFNAAPLGGAMLNAAQDALALGNHASASERLGAFERFVGSQAGTRIPNQWQVGMSDADNVAGDMESRVANLRFLLGRLAGG